MIVSLPVLVCWDLNSGGLKFSYDFLRQILQKIVLRVYYCICLSLYANVCYGIPIELLMLWRLHNVKDHQYNIGWAGLCVCSSYTVASCDIRFQSTFKCGKLLYQFELLLSPLGVHAAVKRSEVKIPMLKSLLFQNCPPENSTYFASIFAEFLFLISGEFFNMSFVVESGSSCQPPCCYNAHSFLDGLKNYKSHCWNPNQFLAIF